MGSWKDLMSSRSTDVWGLHYHLCTWTGQVAVKNEYLGDAESRWKVDAVMCTHHVFIQPAMLIIQ